MRPQTTSTVASSLVSNYRLGGLKSLSRHLISGPHCQSDLPVLSGVEPRGLNTKVNKLEGLAYFTY